MKKGKPRGSGVSKPQKRGKRNKRKERTYSKMFKEKGRENEVRDYKS